jgi:type I restriction enzyme S subunit
MRIDQVELSDFCYIIQGGRLKLSGNDFVSQGFPAYGAGGLNGYLDVAEFDCEAVILSAIGARCGKCFHVNGHWTSLANTQIIIPDPDRADSRFLWHQLNDEKRWPRSGTGQPFIKPSDVKGHKVYLPPLEEQRRIAAILDKCDEIHVADKKRRETLGRFQASYFRHLFGEPSKATENWPLKTIASCSKIIQTGPFGSLLHQSDYIQGSVPILNPKHIANGMIACDKNETIAIEKAEELSGYRLEEGDILLARRGEMGRCAMVTGNENGWLCGTGSMFIRPLRDALAPEYLSALLSTQHMRSKLEKVAIGTTLLNLNSTIVGDLLIPVPPIDLQLRYAEILARLSVIGDITSRSAFARSTAVASIQNKLLTAAGS